MVQVFEDGGDDEGELMSDVLEQNEVDALLAAVDSGDMEEGGSGSGQLFARNAGVKPEDIEIRAYDFKRPERVSKDQMRALQHLHEGFSRTLGASLSGFLRTIIEVKLSSIEQMTFAEFTHSLPNPTCFNLLSCDPLEGQVCLEVSPLIVYPIIDRLLGGLSADLFIPQRPVTAIEQRLVNKILERAMRGLEEAWDHVLGLHFELTESESNPQLVQIVPPNEVVVLVTFELKMGDRSGAMNLCIPYNVIEPVMDKLSSQSWAAYKRNTDDQRLRERMSARLESAKLPVSAVLGETTMKLSDLVNLEPGDVVLTEKPAAAALTLTVGGKRKFVGHLGQYKGNRAFKVSRAATSHDRF